MKGNGCDLWIRACVYLPSVIDKCLYSFHPQLRALLELDAALGSTNAGRFGLLVPGSSTLVTGFPSSELPCYNGVAQAGSLNSFPAVQVYSSLLVRRPGMKRASGEL